MKLRNFLGAGIMLVLLSSSLMAQPPATPVNRPARSMQPVTLSSQYLQEQRLSEVQNLVKSAQEKIQAADWDGARELLDKAGTQCKPITGPNGCSLVDFSQGFYWQQKATTLKGAERSAALVKGKQMYEHVVAVAPSNAAALNNLALIETSLYFATADPQGRSTLVESVTSHWKAAMAGDARQFAKYAVDLGDFLARTGRRNDAVSMYREAASRTDAELPRRRIADNADVVPPADLYRLCGEWRTDYPDVAISCYDSTFHRSFSTNPELARQALLWWAYLLARTDQLSQERLASLPPAWSDSAAVELRDFWKNPANGFHRDGYWLGDVHRASISAELVSAGCKSLGKSPNSTQKVEACLEGFLQARPHLFEELASVPPNDILEEELGSILTFYRNLLSLYARVPDPVSERKSQQLIAEIFQGKGQLILRKSWRHTQDIHAALADIYLQRGVWTGPGATNALFQLRAVITDGDRLAAESQGTLINSLPEVQKLLAKASLMAAEKAKPNEIANLRQQAAGAYVAAAMGYLDYDALDTAKAMLDQYAKLEVSVPSARQISSILSIRLDSARLLPGAVDETQKPLLYRDSRDVSKEFLARQRFKILSDIAGSEKRSQTERLAAAYNAYQTIISGKVTLLGSGDVLRWHRAEQELLSATNARSDLSPVAHREGAKQPENTVSVDLPGDHRPAYITLSQQTPKTAELVKQVGPSEMVRVRKYFYVEHGQILVERSPVPADPTIQKLQQILGTPIGG